MFEAWQSYCRDCAFVIMWDFGGAKEVVKKLRSQSTASYTRNFAQFCDIQNGFGQHVLVLVAKIERSRWYWFYRTLGSHIADYGLDKRMLELLVNWLNDHVPKNFKKTSCYEVRKAVQKSCRHLWVFFDLFSSYSECKKLGKSCFFTYTQTLVPHISMNICTTTKVSWHFWRTHKGLPN